MRKFVIEFDGYIPKTIEPIEQALTEAYRKGFEAGQHEATTLEYHQGLDDAWGIIIKIASIPYAERSEIFDGQQDILSIVQKFSPSEVAAKLREYEQQKADSEIKVGDEVKSLDTGLAYIIHGIDGKYVEGYNFKSRLTCYRNKNDFKKTGRHFPQIAELLKAMKEGAE